MFLLGPFSLVDAEGKDIAPRGRKACAILAMLATGPQARRSRRWLQDRLWSDRDEAQGAASLRQALYEIRQSFGNQQCVLDADAYVVSLNTSRFLIDVDAHAASQGFAGEPPDFLEGMDIRDDAFEEWLREQRGYWRDRLRDRARGKGAEPKTPGGVEAGIKAGSSPRNVPPVADDLLEAIIARLTMQDLRRLAVAVLPLQNRTGIADLAYFTDGLSEDLVERLSRLRWLPVIARSSSFSVAGLDANLRAVSQRLGARYVIDGSIAMDRARYVVRVDLNNAQAESVLWSGTFDLPVETDTEAVEEVLADIVGRVETHIDLAEQRRAIERAGTGSPYDEHIWRGRWHLNKLTRRDAEIARHYFDLALLTNPEGPEALIQSGLWDLWRIWTGRCSQSDIKLVMPNLRRAHMADMSDARGYTLLAIAQSWLRNQEQAIGNLSRAIELNPSLVKAYQQIGTCHYLVGEPEKAVPHLEMAIRLSPNDQHLFVCFGELAMARLMLGDHREATELATRALTFRPNYWYAHVVKLASIERSGDRGTLEAARRVFRNSDIKLADRDFDWVPFEDQKWVAQLKRQAAL